MQHHIHNFSLLKFNLCNTPFKLCLLSIFILSTIQSSIQLSTHAFTITPPQSIQDWKDLSTLVCDTFDAPQNDISSSSSSSTTNTNTNTKKNTWEELKWKLYERQFTIQNEYKRYTSTARKLKGTKYTIFLAKKQTFVRTKMDSLSIEKEEVVGLVELGMTLSPPISTSNQRIEEDKLEREEKERDSISTKKRQPRATIGVLCVKEEYQGQGIGKALVQKCQDRARDIWKESELYVEVQPCNKRALEFFHACGFRKGDPLEIKNATVARRRRLETRPHWILSRSLECHQDDEDLVMVEESVQ